VALLLAVSIAAGVRELSGWSGPAGTLSNNLFIPSVVLASGRGFANVDVARVPNLRAFLDFEQPEFHPGDLPHTLPEVPLDTPQLYCRYLLYTVGVVWRVFGISWDALKILCITLLVWCTFTVYLILRLGMNRILAGIGAAAFTCAPSCLTFLPVLRDFAKAPFFLTAILLMAHLARGPSRPRRLLGCAVLLGAVVGIGLGFRRDLAIGVPAGVVVLALCPCGRSGGQRVLKPAAVAFFLLVFVVLAWPILNSFRERGSQGYHATLGGMATVSDDKMCVQRSSYERIYILHDMFVFSSAERFAGPAAANKDFGDMGQALLLAFWRTFPADMVARAYAASLDVLREGIWSEPNESQRQGPLRASTGVAAACLSLLLISVRSQRTAWLGLFLLGYFGACSALQYYERHVFYLSFASFWFIGFLLDQAGREFVGRWVKRRVQGQDRPGRAGDACGGARSVRGAVTFAILAAVLILSPLLAARLYQKRTVQGLADQYAAAELCPVHTVAGTEGQWRVFELGQKAGSGTENGEARASITTYYAADFLVTPQSPCFWIQYEVEAGNRDFSHAIVLARDWQVTPGRIRCFFPVVEYCEELERTRFKAVVTLAEHADAFLGLHRVENTEAFRLPLVFHLPENREALRWYQGLSLWGCAPLAQCPCGCLSPPTPQPGHDA